MNMSNFKVELKKVVDDSYEIEIGYELEQKLIDDLKAGLVGKNIQICSSYRQQCKRAVCGQDL